MCDPLSIIGAVGSVASAAISAQSRAAANSRQQQANDQWMGYQRRIRAEENARQDAMRGRAEAARQETLGQFDPKNQDQVQQDAQAKLANEWQTHRDEGSDTHGGVANELLEGMAGGGKEFQGDMGRRIASATADARKRIAGLATTASFGSGQYGLGTANAAALARGNEAIRLVGNQRAGSLGAYNIERGIEPPRLSYTESPLSGLAGPLANLAGQGLGMKFGAAAAASPGMIPGTGGLIPIGSM